MLDDITQPCQEKLETKKRVPTPIAGSFLYLTVLILMLLSSVLTAQIYIDKDYYFIYMLLLQLATIGLPTFVYLIMGKKDIKYSIRLGKVSVAEVLLTIGMTIFGYGVMIALNLLWVLVLNQFGTPQSASIPSIETGGQYLEALLIIGLVPAVLEEFMFRGVIQRGYERGGRRIAILLTGVMFAFLHISIVSIPAIILMGILLCFIAYRSDTIWTSITYHFTNNAIAVTLLFLSSTLTKLFPEDTAGVAASLSDIPYDELLVALVAWGFIGFFSLLLFSACLAGFIIVTRGKQAEIQAAMAEVRSEMDWKDILPAILAIAIIIILLVFEVIQMVNPAPIL